MTESAFKPLAVGSPRSGFVLLCSILSHLVPLGRPKQDLRQCLLNGVIDAFGDHIANSVAGVIEAAGLGDRLAYSPAFRKMTGGPKWLHPDQADIACYRKYVGVRGLGDFTLITSHPRETLDYDAVVHCHVDGPRWLREPAYADYQKFASIRNPIGIVNSSLFSINALTSEYIQKFIPPEDDTHQLRERLALFKFTNLDFFEGLVKFYRQWFETFIPVRQGYTIMRWEDLLTSPQDTISRLARAVDLPVDHDHAGQIWQTLGHANLTGAHKHNFRRGGGIVGDWKNWITNRHLEILRAEGFDEVLATFGYDPIASLDESRYTPFQSEVDRLLAAGKVFDDYPDRDLFGFAFNKSNMDSSKFPFKRYGWKQATQIERADFRDEALLQACWDATEAATLRLNRVFAAVLAGRYDTEPRARQAIGEIHAVALPLLQNQMPRAFDAAFPALERITRNWFAAGGEGRSTAADPQPRLIRAAGPYNIVGHAGRFFAIPRALGPLDLTQVAVETLPGVLVGDSFTAVMTAVEAVPAARSPARRSTAWLTGLLRRRTS
jgi:hypothetical protein